MDEYEDDGYDAEEYEEEVREAEEEGADTDNE